MKSHGERWVYTESKKRKTRRTEERRRGLADSFPRPLYLHVQILCISQTQQAWWRLYEICLVVKISVRLYGHGSLPGRTDSDSKTEDDVLRLRLPCMPQGVRAAEDLAMAEGGMSGRSVYRGDYGSKGEGRSCGTGGLKRRKVCFPRSMWIEGFAY